MAIYLCRLSILIHLYLVDWLLRAKTPEELRRHTEMVLKLARSLGILINLDKSHLIPRQFFEHLGVPLDLVRGLVFPTSQAVRKVLLWVTYLKSYRKVTAKGYLSFLGLFSFISDFIPLWRSM